MPTTYAHDRFGRGTYEKLPCDLKRLIREHRKLYLIGLHGPDLFFYYRPLTKNPVNAYGSLLHEQEAAIFFRERIKMYRDNPSDGTEAYLLGFACHFILDSVCHPYINELTKRPGFSHAGIETELDRILMEEDGKNPLSYRPASAICPHTGENGVLETCFPKYSGRILLECLKGIKFYTSVTICKWAWTRKLLLSGMKLVGCYDSMEGRVMRKSPVSRYRESVEYLRLLYGTALTEAPALLCNLSAALHGEEALSERFNRNFE